MTHRESDTWTEQQHNKRRVWGALIKPKNTEFKIFGNNQDDQLS